MTLTVESTDTATSGYRRNALLRLWPDIRPYAGRMTLAVCLVMLSIATSISIPLVIRHVVDGPIARGESRELLWPVVLVALLGVCDTGAIWGRRRVSARPAAALESRLREKVFAHAQRLSIGEHALWDSGQLLSRGVEDLRQLRRFVAFFGPFFIVNTVAIVSVTVTLFFLCWPLGLVLVMCEIPLLFTTIRLERSWRKISRTIQDLVGDIATTVEESVLGIRVRKAFGAGKESLESYSEQAHRLRLLQLRETRLRTMLWSVSAATPILAIALFLLLSGWGVASQVWTLGTVVASISLVMYLHWPLLSIALLLGDLFSTSNAAIRHWELMDRPITITDPDQPTKLPEPLRGEIVFDHVSYRYPDANTPVLSDITLRILPGEILALVGPTGSGKSTLAHLIPRLIDPTSGSITLDGVNTRHLHLRDLRQHIAVAFEEPVLFSASVQENVTLGLPTATTQAITDALELAEASNFVSRLPWGWQTRVGEQGLSLSGGQRQRLALSRAVLGQPRVLVLDDPLSALDVETEQKVQDRLRAATSATSTHSKEIRQDSAWSPTTILVAHRSSTAALADRVALLWDGRIEAIGIHEELLVTSEKYREVMGTAQSRPHV